MKYPTLSKVLVVLVVAGLLATACAPGAQPAAKKDYLSMSWDEITTEAKNEKELTFFSWWGEEYWKEAARLFKEKYGINVNVVMGDNTVEKLLAEKDKATGTIDVQLIGGETVKTTVNAGIWYGPVFKKLPSTDKLDQKLAAYQEGVETKGYLVPIYRNQLGFLYDPDRVKTPPQTWNEFVAWVDANPKGFAYCDPNKGGSGQGMVQAVIANVTGGIDKYKGDADLVQSKVENWNLVWDWFKKYNPKMNLTVSNNESIDLLNQGAASLIIAWDDDTQIALAKGTLFKRAKMYIPTMGLPGGGDSAGIPKNAPHKAAALLFLEFLSAQDMQKMMNKVIGSYPARTDITDIAQLLPEEQRQKYGTTWVPASYKAYLKEQFTKNVLMK